MLTRRHLLDHAADELTRAGVGRARWTARHLLRVHGIDTDLAHLRDPDAALPDDEVARALSGLARLVAGEPLAYVTGWVGFRHLTLQADARALIPRPETEGLVDLALARVRTGVAADIGTGTGAIALALASEGAFDTVHGVDLSRDALALAEANGTRLGIAVRWAHGDLLEPISEPLDLLVSNPPYLTDGEYSALDPSVRDYEPRLALPSGEDGLDTLRRLLDAGRQAVRPGGWIALEVDCRRAQTTAALAEEFGWCEVSVQDDLFGRARYLLARQGSTT